MKSGSAVVQISKGAVVQIYKKVLSQWLKYVASVIYASALMFDCISFRSDHSVVDCSSFQMNVL